MRTIAVLNQKGGVGKTTTVVNTAAALAALGSKVIAIDFDPQAHLTIHLGLEPASINSGSYKVLTQSARLESEIMMVRPNLWLLPANIDLVGAESELVSVVGREIILREALEECKEHFDYCIIDCAPSLGLLTLNALAAAEEVLIPLQPHFLALQGFGKLLQTVELVNRRINPGLKVNGILLCMFDSRASLPNEVKADIERFLNDARGTNSAWAQAHVLPVLVRRNIKLAEAPSYGQTIFEYERNCHGAEDYQLIAEFIHAQSNPPLEPDEQAEVQEEAEQQFESEFPPESAAKEQVEYDEAEDVTSQDDFQNQTQYSEESGQEQPDIQTDYTDISQVSFQESTNEESFEQSEPQETSDSAMHEQSEHFATDENVTQDDFQNQQEPPEESQPEQSNNQPESMNEISQVPPIEIRDIQSYSSPEPDQHAQTSQEQDEPEQPGDNPEPDHQGY